MAKISPFRVGRGLAPAEKSYYFLGGLRSSCPTLNGKILYEFVLILGRCGHRPLQSTPKKQNFLFNKQRATTRGRPYLYKISSVIGEAYPKFRITNSEFLRVIKDAYLYKFRRQNPPFDMDISIK